jgi:hypothetical protein
MSKARFVHVHGTGGASIPVSVPFVLDCFGNIRDAYLRKQRHRITHTTCLQFVLTDASI